MTFPLTKFMQFANALLIDTKEKGMLRLGTSMMGTQRWLLRHIVEGFEEGKREFVTLKCLDPRTRVLMADLRWKQLQDVVPGDELIAFDEHKPTPTTERL